LWLGLTSSPIPMHLNPDFVKYQCTNRIITSSFFWISSPCNFCKSSKPNAFTLVILTHNKHRQNRIVLVATGGSESNEHSFTDFQRTVKPWCQNGEARPPHGPTIELYRWHFSKRHKSTQYYSVFVYIR